jgi:lipoyl(octanoyl) transferase
MQKVFFQDIGLIDYKEAWDYQEKLFNEIVQQKVRNRQCSPTDQVQTNSYLLFCEHPHVYTLGKSGLPEHLLINSEQLEEKKAKYYNINRGGDITYHGPGQLVVYPILDLDNFFTDIHKYLRLLEETVIGVLKEYSINAGRVEKCTGVWLDAENPQVTRKICAMGVRCSRWVTMHGLAFNINCDLNYFNNIVPCGIVDKSVTSLSKELSREIDMNEIKEKIKKHFSELFEAELVESTVIV